MKEKLGVAFKLNETQKEQLDYVKFFYLADSLIAEKFEGLADVRIPDFTEEERDVIHATQKTILSTVFDSFALPLYMTKLMRYPLQAMNDRMDEILSGIDDNDTLRYLLYSGHDV